MCSEQTLGAKSSPNLQSTPHESDTAGGSWRRLSSVSLSDVQKYKDDYLKFEFRPAPFNIRWIYGYNRRVDPINLCTNDRTRMFYAASNCGVVYDWRANDMKLLQGHSNIVTCIASDAEGRWLVTADSGPDNVVTVWDSDGFVPKRTIFNPHGNLKISKIALSSDAKYLLTLAYDNTAILNWWIWSFGLDSPHASVALNIPKSAITSIKFNPTNPEQFFLLSKREIWFGQCTKVEASDYNKEEAKYSLQVRTPPTKGCGDFGKLTCADHVPRSGQTLVGCARGAVLVFGQSLNYVERDETTVQEASVERIRFVKMLKLDVEPINVIKVVDDVVITGNENGELKFYDFQLKLLYWCQGFKVNAIIEITYNLEGRKCTLIDSSNFPKECQNCPCTEHNVKKLDGAGEQQLTLAKVPTDATYQKKPFIIRDFMISTYNEGIGMVDLIDGKYTPILQHRSYYVTTFSVHSEKPFVCIGYEDGQIELIQFIRHKSVVRRDLREHFKIIDPVKPDSINSGRGAFIPTICANCIQYSPSGMHLACGLDNGVLLFLDPTSIDIKDNIPFKATDESIEKICFSQDSSTLALSDSGRKVCVYVYDCVKLEWRFIGKHRAHYAPITQIMFSAERNPNGYHKLFSFGEDRIMVEYDIGESSEEHLEVLSLDRLEQTAVPLAVLEWPAPPGVESDLAAILVANDQHKYKIVNYNTTMTMKTLLGPRFDTPVCRMILAESTAESAGYIVFSTSNLIGIQKLPLDGNPYKHVAMLGHPVEITNMCLHEKSRNLFTSGLKDSCLNQWVVKYRAVDTTSKLGGEELFPYYCLLEGGRRGSLFQEMRDLFYYVQILCQGTYSPAVRRVGDLIPIDSLPDLMRALAFFPSQYEVENFIEEAKYNVYDETPATDIGFEDFVKLYLNHRPAFGEDGASLMKSFGAFTDLETEKGEPAMSSQDFVDIFTNYGECFSSELTMYLLKTLLGQNDDEESSPDENDYSFLPEDLAYKYFVSEILGLEEANMVAGKQNEDDTLSKKSSGISRLTN